MVVDDVLAAEYAARWLISTLLGSLFDNSEDFTMFMLAGSAQMLVMFSLFGGLGVPIGVRLGDEDPAMLAIAPEECLAYVSWADAGKPDPESENEVEQWLSEPEVQHFLKEAHDHLVRLASLGDLAFEPGAELISEEDIEMLLELSSHPAAAYLESVDLGPDGIDVRAGLLIALGDDVETVSEKLENLQNAFLRGQVEAIEIGGESFFEITTAPDSPTIVWGIKDGYLFVGAGRESIVDMLGRMDNAPPQWLVELREKMSVEKISILSYANIEAIMELTQSYSSLDGDSDVLESLGLANVQEYAAVVGFDEGSYVSRSHIGIEGEPEGLFDLLAGEPLPHDALAHVPGDSTVAFAVRVDPAEVVTAFIDFLGPFEREEIMEEIEDIQEDLGIDLFEDILEPLGDICVVYASPSEGGGILTGLTAIISVDDVDQLRKANEQLWEYIQEEQDPTSRYQPFFRKSTFHDQDIYYLARGPDFPWSPAWCITDDALILSVFPQNIRAYLSRDDRFESLLENEEVARSLDATSPILMTYLDPAATYKMAYPWIQIILQIIGSNPFFGGSEAIPGVSILPSPPSVLPHLQPSVRTWSYKEDGYWSESRKILPGIDFSCFMPLTAAASIPATIPARRASEMAQSRNNMKQFCFALHMYAETEGRFPAAYSTDEEGNPLLSWRVHILPLIEQQALYERFHLDEPWDSEHNRELIELMPDIFSSPSVPVGPGKTVYLAVRGEGSVIVDPIDPEDSEEIREGRRFAEIRDGLSRTIVLVEAKADQAIDWTRPGDYEYSDMEPAAGLGTYDYSDFPVSIPADLFLAAIADASVQTLSVRASSEVLQALFDGDDGSNVSPWEADPSEIFDDAEFATPAPAMP